MNRPLTVVVCVLLAAGITLCQHFVVAKDKMVEPIGTSGSAREPVVTDDFTLEIDRVDLSTSLSATDAFGESTEPVEANGVWVLVWARMTAEHTTMVGFPAELRMKDGTTYFEPSWFPDAMDRATLSPGLPLYGAFVFEVPEKEIDEPSLVVTNAPGFEGRLGAQAAVDLELTDTSPSDEPAELLPPQIQAGEDIDAPE
ncbi:hypothetical protein ACWGSK_26670 [Nocardiopsis sp. NPDC055551]|uniref:hypothetical protein n=1 Tax=Nocardiopsis sp. NPDC006832 TaxID=3157188 RepID=UPI003405E2D3